MKHEIAIPIEVEILKWIDKQVKQILATPSGISQIDTQTFKVKSMITLIQNASLYTYD